MTLIRFYDHPLAGTAAKDFRADSLYDWVRTYYADRPIVGSIQFFRDTAAAGNEILHTGSPDERLAQLREENGPIYVVFQNPGDPATTVGAILINIAVAVALTVVSAILFPPPRQPGNVNRTQSSDNNKLADRENKVRYMERVEDIFGTVLSVPSLMMPTYNKYIKHRRVEFGYYCVGRGYYELNDIKDADTLVSGIDGASAAIYKPFTSPNSGDAPVTQIGDAIIDPILTVDRAVEIDGMTLKAWNQVQLPNSVQEYGFAANPGGDYISQGSPARPNFNSVIDIGDTITVSNSSFTRPARSYDQVNYDATTGLFSRTSGFGNITNYGLAVGDTIQVTGFAPTDFLNGTYTVDFVSLNSIGVAESISPSAPDAANGTVSRAVQTYSFDGTYEVAEVGDKQIRLTTSTFPAYLNNGGSAPTGRLQINGRSQFTDWVTLPQKDRTEVWVNVVANNGMYKFDGGYSVATVEFHLEWQQLDANFNPQGPIIQVWGSVSGSVTDERATTLEHVTGWTGPIRVRMRRLTDYDYGYEGTVMDEIKWTDLYAVTPVAKAHFGNKTTIHTVTYPTARATSARTRQLNCLASRLIPTFNGSVFSGAFDAEGRHVSGTIHKTSQIVDIIGAVMLDPKIGNRSVDDVDMAQIYGVQYQLNQTHWEMGQFNYTLDSDNLSLEDTISMIANAAFCVAYRQPTQIRLAPDLRQDRSVAMFTHRNKQPKSETITRTFANDGEYDGVEFLYTDPDSNQTETIILPTDGNYTRLKRFEIPGIRSFAQAWLRANREYKKLMGQRVRVETGVTLDGRALLPNKRIDVVDNTRFKSFDGDVVGWDGALTLRLSQPAEFTPGEDHSIVLMKRDGSLDSIPVTPGADAEHVVLQNLPSENPVTEYGSDQGIRTIFSFAPEGRRAAMAYLITDLDMKDKKYVKVTGINYSDAYYEADTQPIPAKETVIN
ncbi:hypothetical protein W822_19970 [Advenella kashmirensis W13003]|uniref:Tip attachment protein J domain-containing protein n=1 Tax=Advenella kashmirensis W13003 TaxID=1424334 RepID=V8QLT7_9BURK|nr:host specificity factor TipJ family phage tail protein [Advenella kashmirensis]ETF00931.1 hypothetical protein W822_19970 [Advenella kashmirensis W13003]